MNLKLQILYMKYLLIAVLFWGCSSPKSAIDKEMQAWNKITFPGNYFDTTGFVTAQIGRVEDFNIQRGPATSIIKFDSYAQRQAFYRNFGHMIDDFDSSVLCEHIYVAVEPVKIESRAAYIGAAVAKDLVCVKCFHITKQAICYRMDTVVVHRDLLLRGGPVPDTITIKNGKLEFGIGDIDSGGSGVIMRSSTDTLTIGMSWEENYLPDTAKKDTRNFYIGDPHRPYGFELENAGPPTRHSGHLCYKDCEHKKKRKKK